MVSTCHIKVILLYAITLVNYFQGPDIALRTARLFRGSCDTLNIYDCNHYELQIGPFSYQPWPEAETYIQLPGTDYNKTHWSLKNIFSPVSEKKNYVCL